MEISPVRNESNYQAALKEIERFIDSQPGIPKVTRWKSL